MAFKQPQNLVLLATRSASSSATIDFASVISSTYKTYLIKIRDMLPATNATNLQFTFSANNGSSYLNSNYSWATFFLTPPGDGSIGNASDSFCQLIDLVSSTTPINGEILLYDIDVALKPSYRSEIVAAANSVPILAYLYGTGTNSTTTINALRFAMSSGNIASGNFYMYGVVEP